MQDSKTVTKWTLREIKATKKLEECNELIKQGWVFFEKYTLINEPTTIIMARYEKVEIS